MTKALNIGSFSIHRKEQWDLASTPDVVPIVCVHRRVVTPEGWHGCRRVFCLWWGGVQIGKRYIEWAAKVRP